MDLNAAALAAVRGLQAPTPPAAPPAHLQGLLAQAAQPLAPPPGGAPHPSTSSHGVVPSITFRAPAGESLRSAPGFLSSFCGDVRASRSEAELAAAANALQERLFATGAYKSIRAEVKQPPQQPPSLELTLDEFRYSLNTGCQAVASGNASANAKGTLINVLGYAESLTASWGSEAPLSMGVGGADGAGGLLGAAAALNALALSGFRLHARKPSLAGTPASLELQLRSLKAPLSSQSTLTQGALEAEASFTDASGVHSLGVSSALRSLQPLRPPAQPAHAPTLTSPQALQHCLASVKNSLTYAAHLGQRAPQHGPLATRRPSGSLRLELAGLGGDAVFAKATLAGSWAGSLGRYAPDTGYCAPGAGGGAGGALRPFPGAAGLLPWAPAHWASEQLAAWLSPGVTLTLDGLAGVLQPLGSARAGAASGGASHMADRFFLPDGGASMRGFASLGPRGSAAGGAGGGALGDALGADALAAVTARVLLPPPLPIPVLLDYGVRSYAFASLGAAALHGSGGGAGAGAGGGAGGVGGGVEGAARALGALGQALVQRPSASYGIGLVR